MKPVTPTKPKEFEAVLTEEAVKYIRWFTQNPPDRGETDVEETIRLSLFVGASRLLGYQVNDDGTQQFN
jgi:hypothetical protein